MDGLDNDVAAERAAVARAQDGLVDREAIAEAVVLRAVAGEHLLVGPPGTGKSEAVRRIAELLGGRYFEYLLGRVTEPNELFGPIYLRRLREGVVEVETAGMLPEAEVAFLDEVFLGSTAILDTLLGMLDERVFRRGRTAMPGALRICIGCGRPTAASWPSSWPPARRSRGGPRRGVARATTGRPGLRRRMWGYPSRDVLLRLKPAGLRRLDPRVGDRHAAVTAPTRRRRPLAAPRSSELAWI